MSMSMPISMSMSMSSDSNLRHEQNNDENISISENNDDGGENNTSNNNNNNDNNNNNNNDNNNNNNDNEINNNNNNNNNNNEINNDNNYDNNNNNTNNNNTNNNNNNNNNNGDEDAETNENNKIDTNPNNNFFNSENNKSHTEIDEVPEPGSEPFKDYIKSIVERNQFITQPPDPKKIQFTANNVNANNNGNNLNIGLKRKHSVVENDNLNLSIKKCSRCRMKRSNETEVELNKYQTCSQCRNRRKVKERRPRTPMKLPNLSDDWQKFMEKISLNNVIDLYQHNYRAYTNEIEFPRYKPDQLNTVLIQEIGEKVIEKYIQPIQDLTGFKLAVRDHHNPSLFDPNRAKKITWMYICSQDKLRKRKSRSENKRQVLNRLKTEECDSKITLSYDIVNGIVQISYNHKHHKPMGYKNVYENGASDQQIDLNIENENLNHSVGGSGSGHENDVKNNNQLDNSNPNELNNQNVVNNQEDVVAAAAAAAAAVAVAVNEQRNNNNNGNKGAEKNVFEEIPDQNNQFSEINMPITEGTEVEVGVHDSIDNSIDETSEKDQTAAAVAEITKLIKQAEHRRQLETNDLMEIANRARGELEKDQNKDGAHYLINQSLLEQVRIEGQEIDDVNDEDDEVPIDHELLRESEN